MAYVTQQIIKTTDGWAAFDALGKPVPKDYWLFERVTEGDVRYYKFKISDGVHLFSELPYQLLNGGSARISSDGYWETFNDATQQYEKTTVKALGVDGKSAFELWQSEEGNADKTLADFFNYLKGAKGDPFTYSDFTPEQLADLTGKSAYQVWQGQPGNEGKTIDEYLATIKGDPFTYSDFTPEQLADLTGKSAYQVWQSQPGNEGKTVDDYLQAIKGKDGVIPVDAPSDGKTYGRKDEGWAEIKNGELSQDQMDAILDAFNAIPFDRVGTTSITQDQMDTLMNAIPSTLTKNVYHKVSYTSVGPEVASVTTIPIYSGYLGLDEDGQIALITDFSFSDIYYASIGIPSTTGFTISIAPDLSISFINRYLVFRTSGRGTDALMDDGTYKKVFDPKSVTTATTLTNLSIENYSIKVTLSAASALSFASTPYEGWECMIDIKNTGSSAITQALPNASGWQCDEESITIAAGKIASISVRYVHGTYVVLSKGN